MAASTVLDTWAIEKVTQERSKTFLIMELNAVTPLLGYDNEPRRRYMGYYIRIFHLPQATSKMAASTVFDTWLIEQVTHEISLKFPL